MLFNTFPYDLSGYSNLRSAPCCLLFTIRLFSSDVFSLFSLIHFEEIWAPVSSHI